MDSGVAETIGMIPVLGFCTLNRFDLAERLIASIDYPVEHLVIVDNSGSKEWTPPTNHNVVNQWVLQIPFGLGLVGAWNLIIKSTPYAPYWLLINDDAWFEPNSLKIIADNADPSAMNFLDVNPRWSAVVFGEQVIDKVGLYDERFYPLYFDDNDLERRMARADVPVKDIHAKIHHENSSTLNSGFHDANGRSYGRNQALLNKKIATNDFTAGEWSLRIRRENRWD